jgi:hypothetical protein
MTMWCDLPDGIYCNGHCVEWSRGKFVSCVHWHEDKKDKKDEELQEFVSKLRSSWSYSDIME